MSVAVNGAAAHSPRAPPSAAAAAAAAAAATAPTGPAAPLSAVQKLAQANESTWLLIGAVAEQMDELERAQVAYENALRHNPHSVSGLMQLAGIARIKENYPKAVDYFQRVVDVAPNHGDAWSAIGHCYLMQDDLQKAYGAYQQALYWLPNPKDDPKLWYGIGILYDRYGSLDHAEEAFASVLRMDRDFDKANEILFRLGIIYKQQGKYAQSLECFERILRSPPNPLAHVDIWFQMGHVYEQQKDYHRAKDAYERVVQDKPHHAKVLQQLGWLHHQPDAPFQNQELAIQYLTKSLEADPADAQSWYLLGRAYMQGQKYNKAYEAYQQAVYRDGRNPTFWCSIGVLYFQINQYRDALDAYSRAIRINPYISEVWFDLGSLYESCNNQISDAIDAYARASELDPGNQVISHRLSLLRNAQETGSSVPAAPGPQDVHPTAYAGSHAGAPALHPHGAPPLLFSGPAGRSIFTGPPGPGQDAPRMVGPGMQGEVLPPPPAARGSPGPFRGGPPPPVVLDDARAGRLPLHTPLAPMDIDRPHELRSASVLGGPAAPPARGNGLTMGPGGVLLHHPQPQPQPQPPRYERERSPPSPHSTTHSGEGPAAYYPPPPRTAFAGPGAPPQASPTARFDTYGREGVSPRSEKAEPGWERRGERGRALREASRERNGRAHQQQQQQQQYMHASRGGSPAPYPYDARRAGSPPRARNRSNSDERGRRPATMQPPERWAHWEHRERERERERERPAFRSPSMATEREAPRRYDPRYDERGRAGAEEERKYAPGTEEGFKPPPAAAPRAGSSSMLGLSTLPPPPQPNISSMHAPAAPVGWPRMSESPAPPEKEKERERKRRGAKVKEEDGASSGVEKKERKKRAPGKRAGMAAAAAAAAAAQAGDADAERRAAMRLPTGWAAAASSNGGSASTSAGRSPETMGTNSRRSPPTALPPLRPVDEDYDEGVDALMGLSAYRPPPPQLPPASQIGMAAPPPRAPSTSPTARAGSRASNRSERSHSHSHSHSMTVDPPHSLKRPHSGSDVSDSSAKRARVEAEPPAPVPERKASQSGSSRHSSVHNSPVEPRAFGAAPPPPPSVGPARSPPAVVGLQGPGEAPLRLPPISTLSPKASISPPTSAHSTHPASPAEARRASRDHTPRDPSPHEAAQDDEDDRMQLDSASPPPQAIRVSAESKAAEGDDGSPKS